MIVISYWRGPRRVGMLAWREPQGEAIQALGGYDISAEDEAIAEADPPGFADRLTIVSTDREERELPGWIHPDQILELCGGNP